MAKRTKHERPNRSVSKSKSKIASLMPIQGEEAKEQQAAIKLSMFMTGLIGNPDETNRIIRAPTAIRELRALRLSPAEAKCLETTMAAEAENFPGGVAVRYRIELAAAFLASAINLAYDAAATHENREPDVLAQTYIDLVIARAREIWAEDGE